MRPDNRAAGFPVRTDGEPSRAIGRPNRPLGEPERTATWPERAIGEPHRPVGAPERAAGEPGGAGAANDRAMDPIANSTTEPADTASERLPAGVRCYQCKYDLAGRVPGEPCPECGLDVAASWPAWDLRACHPAYIEHLRYEAVQMRRVALVLAVAIGLVLVGVATLFAELKYGYQPRASIILMIVGGSTLLFWPVFLVQLARTVSRRAPLRHMGDGENRRPDEGEPPSMRWGVWLAGAAVVLGGPVAAIVSMVVPLAATLLAFTALIFLCIGVANLILNIADARAAIIERTGRPRPSGLGHVLLVLPWAALPLSPGVLGVEGPFAGLAIGGVLISLVGSAHGMVWLASRAVQETNVLIGKADAQERQTA